MLHFLCLHAAKELDERYIVNDLPPVDSSHPISILPYQHTGARVQGPNYQGNINLIFSYRCTHYCYKSVNYATSFVPSAKELDEKNIVNVLHEAEFADGDWELLGLQLIKHTHLTTIRANRRGEVSLCMKDMVSQWLKSESQPSWNKLAEAVEKVEGYGKATAKVVQQIAGIGRSDFIFKGKIISINSILCTRVCWLFRC